MSGFNLSDKKSTSKPVVDQFCLAMCEKLRNFVKQMRWSPVSRTPKKWSDSVRLLRNDITDSLSDGNSPSRDQLREAELSITTVLDKYLSLSPTIGFHPDKTGGFPKCKDMKQFRNCWDWINNVITKHERDNPTNTTVTDQARSIATVLKRKSWPSGSADKLEMAVQVSLDNYKQLWDKLQSVLVASLFPAGRIPEKEFQFGVSVRNKIGSPDQFVLEWFEAVHKRVGDWTDWNGNLMLEVFAPNKKQLHKWGRSVSVSWSGKTDLWAALAKRLGIDNGT